MWSLAEMKAGNIPNVASYFRVFCIHTDCMPSYDENSDESMISQATVNPLLSPPGGLFFSSTFEWGLNREGGGLKKRGGLFNLAKCINGNKVSGRRTCGYRTLYCFF